MTDRLADVRALLLDLDGVLYVEDEPVPGAVDAVAELRERGLSLRFVTNTTARPRRRILDRLDRLGFALEPAELATPAALAVRHCQDRGFTRVALVMNDEVKEDFAALEEVAEGAEAVIVGDLGSDFGYERLNAAFRQVMDGAELVALQKNRFWLTPDGLSLDVGPFVAALEYATEREAHVVGKPARAFFETVLATVGVPAAGRRWSATTWRATSAAPSRPASRASSCARASIARTPSAPRRWSRPRPWARSPTCRRSWPAVGAPDARAARARDTGRDAQGAAMTPGEPAAVLAAYDGSPAAQAALRAVGALMGGARVTVLTVHRSLFGLDRLRADRRDAAEQLARGVMDEVRATAEEGARLAADAGLRADPVVVDARGRISSAITASAREHGADLIAMGTRGRAASPARCSARRRRACCTTPSGRCSSRPTAAASCPARRSSPTTGRRRRGRRSRPPGGYSPDARSSSCTRGSRRSGTR